MTNEQLSRLLNTACEIINDLEDFYFHMHKPGDPDNSYMEERLNAFFNEIKYSEELDSEQELSASQLQDPDLEAQDSAVFGDKKI